MLMSLIVTLAHTAERVLLQLPPAWHPHRTVCHLTIDTSTWSAGFHHAPVAQWNAPPAPSTLEYPARRRPRVCVARVVARQPAGGSLRLELDQALHCQSRLWRCPCRRARVRWSTGGSRRGKATFQEVHPALDRHRHGRVHQQHPYRYDTTSTLSPYATPSWEGDHGSCPSNHAPEAPWTRVYHGRIGVTVRVRVVDGGRARFKRQVIRWGWGAHSAVCRVATVHGACQVNGSPVLCFIIQARVAGWMRPKSGQRAVGG